MLELHQPPLPDAIFFKADEILRTSVTTYEVTRGEVASSKLPSDPGLKVLFTTATIEEQKLPTLSIFGQEVVDRATGQVVTRTQDWVKAKNVFFELEDVPFFYLPFLSADARDPLGPVESISGGYNNIYGVQFDITFNMYELLGVQPLDGTKWRLMADYLSLRGPRSGRSSTTAARASSACRRKPTTAPSRRGAFTTRIPITSAASAPPSSDRTHSAAGSLARGGL